MRKYLNLLYKISGWIAAAFLAAICLLVVCQVCLNIIDRLSTFFTGEAIGLTIPSYADFTGYFLAAASFLALAFTLREGGHIRVSLILNHLPTAIRFGAELWSIVLAAAISYYFTWFTFSLTHESFIYNDLSPGMVAVPIWIPQSTMLVGLLILSIALTDELFQVVRGKKPSYAGRGENLMEEDPATTET